MPGVAKPQKKFLVTLFVTILLIRGKVNFRNLSRYSDLSEKTYARQFRQSFDFADFNERLMAEIVPPQHEKIGAMDCSYLTKSGRKTYGLGFFYDEAFPQEIKDYIRSGEQGNIQRGYKCRIRKRWYDVPSIYIPNAFLFRQIHRYPLLVVNEAKAASTDTIHRVRVKMA